MPPGLSYGSRVHVSATKLCAFLLCSAPHDERCSLSEHSMRARKKLLRSCSFLKETIFRRGLDADRGIGDIVHRYLASRRGMVFLLTTESVFQGCCGLFLNGSLPRHARCATHWSIETSLLLRNKRDDQRYESSLNSDNLLCAVCLCILSDTMRRSEALALQNCAALIHFAATRVAP
jgi:hypothetical protein